MATKPGLLTDWPWKPLGSFKYVLLAPLVMESIYSLIVKEKKDTDMTTHLIFPFLLLRMLHNQLWISLSRHRTAVGHRIVDRPIDFEQVDRETNWDDQILLNGLLYYVGHKIFAGASHMPFWRTDGIILITLLHAGPVEFLYYWFHRALHHHFLYSRYHSHHHSSIVTEPITSVIHPFAEHIAYFMLFAIPLLTTVFTRTASLAGFFGYIMYIDFMNNLGHCNFELVPSFLFSVFPPLKFLMYTPSFHSLHHTQFRTNYSLFMPFYDYIYGTVDKSSDALHRASLEKAPDSADVVHLTHLTTLDSIYHMRWGFASWASRPYASKWYTTWLLQPISFLVTWLYPPRPFLVESNRFHDLTLQTWALPKYTTQYVMQGQKKSINSMIEETIEEAEQRGVKVFSLGLLNQGEELNYYGGLYVERNRDLKIKVVDGSRLAAAVVLNSIPKGTKQVLFIGHPTKVAYAVVFALSQRGIQVGVLRESEYDQLNKTLTTNSHDVNLILSKSYSVKVWLVGDGLSEEDQKKAMRGTVFIPFSQLPPTKVRKDCFYHHTPAMATPFSLDNLHSCENWLPRRAMSAWRIAGIVHAVEGWKEHECGCYTNLDSVSSIDKVWEATLRHGFRPLNIATLPYFVDSTFP